jgi:ubiquinone/menaquinone biosynthesis C-methylase UbiE
VLDLCCGTGSALLGFAEKVPVDIAAGCDFSRGMLRQALKKKGAEHCRWIECDVTQLPFTDGSFEVVTCSHALYELKGQHRKMALLEMRRVVRPGGIVLVMEHEVPRHPVTKFFFNIRMASMGSQDAWEFVAAGDKPYRSIFPDVVIEHTPSGKSKVFKCKK